MDDYKKLITALSEVGGKITQAGLGFAYHNHDFEFEKFGGEVSAFDMIFDTTDPNVVKVEMDAYWVKKAGLDPVHYLHKYAGRVPLIHVKDMTTDGKFAQVGEGITDSSRSSRRRNSLAASSTTSSSRTAPTTPPARSDHNVVPQPAKDGQSVKKPPSPLTPSPIGMEEGEHLYSFVTSLTGSRMAVPGSPSSIPMGEGVRGRERMREAKL
jgi:hypothetical protein